MIGEGSKRSSNEQAPLVPFLRQLSSERREGEEPFVSEHSVPQFR